MKKLFTLPLLVTASLFCFTSANAQYSQTAKIVSANREARAEYGTSVAIRNNFAVVGASRENVASGNAYVYQKDGTGHWAYLQTFTAPDPNAGAEFGGGAKITENNIVIAAGRADVQGVIRAGALYVYNLNGLTWEYSTKLVANDFSGDAKMGMNPTSLAVENNTIVAGAPGENGWIGSVYIFDKTGGVWIQTQKLMSPNPQANDAFGIGVDISGDYLVVGASEEDNTYGAVHIFSKDGSGNWVHVQKIVASDGNSQAYFGCSVSIDNGLIAVGAYGDNGGTGATYIFKEDGSGNWSEIQKITASTPSSEANYGWNCKIENNRLVVSAPHPYGFQEGEVYVYSKDDAGVWNEIQKVSSLDLAPEDFYGWNFEMYNGQLIVGATWEDEDENGENTIDRAGSAYIFEDPAIVGIEASAFVGQLNIFPVPARENINISSDFTISALTVTNQLGVSMKQVNHINQNNYTLDVSKFAEGIYFVHIMTNKGQNSFKKIIISN